MLYDLSNPLHSEQFKLRVNKLYQSKAVVELTEKKTKRSLPQNKYLHLILGYFGVETGNTLEWVKREYFKKLCNKDIFVKERVDNITNQRTKYLRSSADLTTDEMTTAIERFRNWASQEAGVYIPSPDEQDLLIIAEIETERNRQYL